ncbi:MAG: hypothetical protein ACLQBJ_02085, partial [Bryobacteraceae bacterium]
QAGSAQPQRAAASAARIETFLVPISSISTMERRLRPRSIGRVDFFGSWVFCWQPIAREKSGLARSTAGSWIFSSFTEVARHAPAPFRGADIPVCRVGIRSDVLRVFLTACDRSRD